MEHDSNITPKVTCQEGRWESARLQKGYKEAPKRFRRGSEVVEIVVVVVLVVVGGLVVVVWVFPE